jgi:hypothetical protein
MMRRVLPDVALIVSAYALARLLNEYIVIEQHHRGTRTGLAVIVIVIDLALFDVLGLSGSVPL